jgi:catechol 2,3-dioxygenase-like lactoylglutathione lyase family enzyme
VNFDHVQLGMPAGRESEARLFFTGILGMTEDEKPENLKSRGGCWFHLGACVLHVGVDPDFRPQGEAHPAFLSADLEGLARRLESSGFEVTWDRSIPGVHRFYTADPFGNRLEFIKDGQGLSQAVAG